MIKKSISPNLFKYGSIKKNCRYDTFILFLFPYWNGTYDEVLFCKRIGAQTVLNLSKHDWEILHLYVGLLMLAAVVLHLFSSKTWIVKVGAQNKKWLAISVIGLGIIMILALALSPAELAK